MDGPSSGTDSSTPGSRTRGSGSRACAISGRRRRAAPTSSSSTATASRVVTSSPRSVAAACPAGSLQAPDCSSARASRARCCATTCRSGRWSTCGPHRSRARRDPRTGPPHAARPAQGLAAGAPRLRSARQRLRVLHRCRARRLRGGERVRRAVRRVGRPGRRSGGEAPETRAALRVRGAAVGDAPPVASLERARGPSDLGAAAGDDRERPHRGARRIPRARVGAGGRRATALTGNARALRNHHAAPPDGRAAPEPPPRGVNVVGFFEAESGLGEVARRLAARSTRQASRSRRSRIARRSAARTICTASRSADEAPYDTNLSASAPTISRGSAPTWAALLRAQVLDRGLVLGDERLPRRGSRRSAVSRRALGRERLRPSERGRRGGDPGPRRADAGRATTRPAFARARSSACRTRSRSSSSSTSGAGSGRTRRRSSTPFVEAFRPGEGPILVLKSIHGRDWRPDQFAERRRTRRRAERTSSCGTGTCTEDDRDSYVAACDCYVSLHRSEGLGLTLAEAMASGKPVIATGYSGNLEFMREHDELPRALPASSTSRRAGGHHAPGAVWAEPDVECSRTPHASRLGASRRGTRHRRCGSRRARSSASRSQRTAAFVADRLADARTRGAIERTDVASRRATGDPGRVAVARRGGTRRRLAAGRRARPTSVVRRLLRRALWPYLEDQRRFELRGRSMRCRRCSARSTTWSSESSGSSRVLGPDGRAGARDRAAQLSAKRVTSSSSPSAPEYS